MELLCCSFFGVLGTDCYWYFINGSEAYFLHLKKYAAVGIGLMF